MMKQILCALCCWPLAMQASEQTPITGEIPVLHTAPAVQETESGITYQILKRGDGEHPRPDSVVRVHYVGKLPNGHPFDNSRERGSPLEFKLNQVIEGWQEILPMMREGGHWRIEIPAKLAYGSHGVPGVIPPNMPLIFDIELLKVVS